MGKKKIIGAFAIVPKEAFKEEKWNGNQRKDQNSPDKSITKICKNTDESSEIFRRYAVTWSSVKAASYE